MANRSNFAVSACGLLVPVKLTLHGLLLDHRVFGAKHGFRCARSWLARLLIVA
jgi:hypothetical protein